MVEKNWYESKTVWGGIVALGAAVAGLFGLHVDANASADLTAALTDAVAAIGAVVAILGRFDARTRIV